MEAILSFYSYMPVLFAFGGLGYIGLNSGMPKVFLTGAAGTVVTLIYCLISACF